LTAEILGVIGQLLPAGQNKKRTRGHETRSLQRPILAALTVLGRVAAKRFLQPAQARS